MDDGLNCERDVPGNTRQTNALSFYSLGNEVDKGRSRTASLIYKSIVIGNTDKFSVITVMHLFCLHIINKSYTESYTVEDLFPRFDEKFALL